MQKLEERESALQAKLGSLKSEHEARDDHFSRMLDAVTADLTAALTSAKVARETLARNEARIEALQAQARFHRGPCMDESNVGWGRCAHAPKVCICKAYHRMRCHHTLKHVAALSRVAQMDAAVLMRRVKVTEG
jgi:hypothetical protein